MSKTSVWSDDYENEMFVGAASGDEQSVLIAVHGIDESVIDEMKRENRFDAVSDNEQGVLGAVSDDEGCG